MKTPIFLFVLVALSLLSCDQKDTGEYADYLVAHPLTMSVSEFRESVKLTEPVAVENSGKIYAYKNLIFINESHKGIHLIDNSNPAAPKKTAFIKIPGNVDISIRGDYLFADSLNDLVVLDISDLGNIREVNRLENVLQDNIIWPMEADIFEFDGYDPDSEILLGWEIRTERRSIESFNNRQIDMLFAENAADVATGEGGSLARFKIVNDFLYAVDNHFINVFDITELDNPLEMGDVYAGFDIETIFNRGDHLFLGSMRGMYIYDISIPAQPEFISEFQHGTACDPVVVDGDYAYVTLRGGNNCGALESGLFIVDISDIRNPRLEVNYPMDEPYGLGVHGNQLYVCDGASGLKVFDKTDILDLKSLNHYKDVRAFDVIPLEEVLLLIGEGRLSQYEYLPDGIRRISVIDL